MSEQRGRIIRKTQELISRVAPNAIRSGNRDLPQHFKEAADLIIRREGYEEADIRGHALDDRIKKALIYHASTRFRGADPLSIERSVDSTKWRLWARGKLATGLITSQILGPIAALGGMTSLAATFQQNATLLEPLKSLLNPIGQRVLESAKFVGPVLGAVGIPLSLLSVISGRIMARFPRKELEAATVIRDILKDENAMSELREAVIGNRNIMVKADELLDRHKVKGWKKALTSYGLAAVGMTIGFIVSGAVLPSGNPLELAKLLRQDGAFPFVDSSKIVESFGKGTEFMAGQLKNMWSLFVR